MTQNTRVITQTEFSLDVSYKVFYSTKDPVPIDEMVSALLAIERILKRAPRVFSAVTGVPIEKTEVYVQEIVSGSLSEDIIVKLFFKDQAGLMLF